MFLTLDAIQGTILFKTSRGGMVGQGMSKTLAGLMLLSHVLYCSTKMKFE